jgi:HEAT repeat protein
MLAQLPGVAPIYRQTCRSILLQVMRNETSIMVTKSLAFAFGHVHSARALPFLTKLAQHKLPALRLGAAFGLGCMNQKKAIDALIYLSSDSDFDVRNWATFGLGSLNSVDSPKLRTAQAKRLDDRDGEIRSEAILGLAIRKDTRAKPALIKEFERGYYGSPLLEAATEIRSAALLPYLNEIAPYLKKHKALQLTWQEAQRACAQIN